MTKETKYEGKFLELKELTLDNGSKWETVERKGNTGAVSIIALDEHMEVILVKQFRPPLNNYCIELPAGLVDEGETPEQAAIRELKEETGYISEAAAIPIKAFSSPGMTNEFSNFVFVTITGKKDQDLKDNESIEVILIPFFTLGGYLKEQANNGVDIDGKLLGIAVGLAFLTANNKYNITNEED
jgi:8-oxo-dGTP pyrophosphatase MutT (NUDIX family)